MTFHFSFFLRIGVTALIGVAVLWIAAANSYARDGSKEWIVLKGCRLIPNPANDGDSFHVSVGPNEYLFRLYFVDAPETDEMTPRRLSEQAKYFAISVPQAIEAGRAAKAFTRQKLSLPFTVFTHMSDAMGQSRLERFYAFIQTSQGDLGEQLVRSGLGRNYGFKEVPPGLASSRIELGKLQQFENEARQEKIGAWGISMGRLDVRPSSPSSFSHFAISTNVRRPRLPAPLTFPSTGMASPFIPSRGTPGPNRQHSKQKTPFGKIDINDATEKELTTVPGIGPVMAARIIAARPFQSADDLERVSGIGDKKYVRIRPYFQ